MGGRGASSGLSNKGKVYGTEYDTVHQVGNIKFVKYLDGNNAKSPMETMRKRRIYATISNDDKVKYISFYDKDNKRFMQIDVDHFHNIEGVKVKPHVHRGYEHNENGDRALINFEKKIVDKVLKEWNNYKNKL